MKEKLEHDFGVKVKGELDGSMNYKSTHSDLTSPYSHFK